jgi:hypothetical protein
MRYRLDPLMELVEELELRRRLERKKVFERSLLLLRRFDTDALPIRSGAIQKWIKGIAPDIVGSRRLGRKGDQMGQIDQ